MTAAYRIVTNRLVIRCWSPTDAPLLSLAIEASMEHLRPWMPWIAGEPKTIDARMAFMRSMRAQFDTDEEYVYGIFDAEEKNVLGGTGLHRRVGPRAFEIGYWVHAAHINRGIATEVSGALTRVGFAIHDALRMEIHCDPKNERSAAVPRKLGYRYDGTLRGRLVQNDETLRDTMVWTLQRAELPGAAAASVSTRAYDALGRELLL